MKTTGTALAPFESELAFSAVFIFTVFFYALFTADRGNVTACWVAGGASCAAVDALVVDLVYLCVSFLGGELLVHEFLVVLGKESSTECPILNTVLALAGYYTMKMSGFIPMVEVFQNASFLFFSIAFISLLRRLFVPKPAPGDCPVETRGVRDDDASRALHRLAEVHNAYTECLVTLDEMLHEVANAVAVIQAA